MNRTEPPPYVVPISGTKNGLKPFNGTGFIVDTAGHVVTCLHVVSEADEINVHFPYTKPCKYCISKKLEKEDLVLLESIVPPSTGTPKALLHPDWQKDTAVGHKVTVWGFSAPEHYSTAQKFDCTISSFSQIHGRIGLNGDINLGDSGAPVIDSHGKVIGIAQVRDPERNGQAMAVPISRLFEIFQPRTYEQSPGIPASDVLLGGEPVVLQLDVADKMLKKLNQWYSEGVIAEEIKTEYTRKILDRHLLMER